MNIFRIITALLLGAYLPFQIYGLCENDRTFTVTYMDRDYSCKSLRMPNNAEARFNVCQDSSTRSACPHSCGVCCEDSETYEFKLLHSNPSGQLRPCSWILQSSKDSVDAYRQETYCNGYHSGDRTVRDGCPVSCNFCFDFVGKFLPQ